MVTEIQMILRNKVVCRNLKEWIKERILDKLLALVEPIFSKWIRKVNVNYERVLKAVAILLCGIAVCFGVFWWIVDEGLFLEISILANVSKISTTQPFESVTSFQCGLGQALTLSTSFFAILSVIAYVLLRIEKGNNRLSYRQTHRCELRISNQGVAELLALISVNEGYVVSPDRWKQTTLTVEEITNLRRRMISTYIKRFNDVCEKLSLYLTPHIRECNPEDIVNISIKLFLDGTGKDKRVLTLGKAISQGDPRDIGSRIEYMNKEWEEIVAEESYGVEQDYAMRILLERQCKEAFCCGDIDELAKSLQNTADKGGAHRRYATPSPRSFKATIVVPILVLCNGNSDSFKVAGVICIDTTNVYTDWNQHGSYEENLISIAAGSIPGWVVHIMEELETASKVLRELNQGGTI